MRPITHARAAFVAATLNALLLPAAIRAENTPQVEIETHVLATTSDYHQQLGIDFGLAIPTGEFADKAGTGFRVGIYAREQLTPRLAIGFHGGWSLFGGKDLTAQGFGEPTVVTTEIGPEIEILLKELRQLQGQPTSLDDIAISLVGGFDFGSLGVTQDFGASGFPDAKSAETQPLIYVGPQFLIPIGEKGQIFARGQYNHIFTGNGGENWIGVRAGYLHQLNSTNYDRYQYRNSAWGGNGLLGPLSTLSVRTICGMPINDFHDVAIPGLGIGVNGTFPITDALSGVFGASYQTYGTPGFQEESNDRAYKSYELDAGVQFDVRIPEAVTDTYIQITINPVFLDYKDFPTPSVILSDNGFFLTGGLGVRRAITDRVSVGVLSDIPVVGFLFDNEPTKRVRTELFITLTPRIVAGN